VNIHADIFDVCLLPWRVLSLGQDNGLTRHNAVSWELSYCIPWELAGRMSPTDAYHGRSLRWSANLPLYRLAV